MKNVPVSLAQLVGTSHYVQELGFEPRTLHLFTFKEDFLATRLLVKQNHENYNMDIYLGQIHEQ